MCRALVIDIERVPSISEVSSISEASESSFNEKERENVRAYRERTAQEREQEEVTIRAIKQKKLNILKKD